MSSIAALYRLLANCHKVPIPIQYACTDQCSTACVGSVSVHKLSGGPPCLWSVPYTGMDFDVSDVFEKLL